MNYIYLISTSTTIYKLFPIIRLTCSHTIDIVDSVLLDIISSLVLRDLVNRADVRLLFQYGVGLGLRGCYSSMHGVRLWRSRSALLITNGVYTRVSERVSE